MLSTIAAALIAQAPQQLPPQQPLQPTYLQVAPWSYRRRIQRRYSHPQPPERRCYGPWSACPRW